MVTITAGLQSEHDPDNSVEYAHPILEEMAKVYYPPQGKYQMSLSDLMNVLDSVTGGKWDHEVVYVPMRDALVCVVKVTVHIDENLFHYRSGTHTESTKKGLKSDNVDPPLVAMKALYGAMLDALKGFGMKVGVNPNASGNPIKDSNICPQCKRGKKPGWSLCQACGSKSELRDHCECGNLKLVRFSLCPACHAQREVGARN